MTWSVDARSVNARGLDIRLRLPPGEDALDPILRDMLRKRFHRGAVTLAVSVSRDQATSAIRVSEDGMKAALSALDTVTAGLGARASAAVDPVALLSIRGVMDLGDDDPSGIAADHLAAFRATASEALESLANSRANEGTRLAEIIGDQLETIATLTAQAEASPERGPDAIRARLSDAVDRLFDADPRLDVERLHQEAMVLGVKADIQEELDRLKAHVDRGRELLASDGAIGRQLDFLSQEFNREANTLCSKANHLSITRIGLDMKTAIDQMREQVQNLE